MTLPRLSEKQRLIYVSIMEHAAVGFIFRLDDGKVFAIPNNSAVECLKLKTEYRSNKVLVKFTSPS